MFVLFQIPPPETSEHKAIKRYTHHLSDTHTHTPHTDTTSAKEKLSVVEITAQSQSAAAAQSYVCRFADSSTDYHAAKSLLAHNLSPAFDAEE